MSVADFLPPVIAGAQISGAVQPGGTYKVCTQVTDQGNPPAGVGSVRADVGAIAGSPSTVTLSAGSCPTGSYNYVSGTLTASSGLTPGATVGYSITAADTLGQSATQSYTATVQAPPSSCRASSITATNGGAAVQQIDSGDVILFGFTTTVDQGTIVPGWTGGGSPGPTTIRVKDGGTSDTITIEGTSLGTIQTNTSFVTGGDAVFMGTLTMQGNNVRLSVDYKSSGSGTPVTGAASAMTWTPGSGIKDTSGNACSTASVTQPSSTANF